MASIFDVVLDERGGHIGAEVMVGVRRQPEIPIYQRRKRQGLSVRGQF